MFIGRISGIPIRLHWSFLILMVGFVAQSWWAGGFAQVLTTGTLMTGLFTSVLLHELGHALTAQAYGIRTRDITLYPFGGAAALENMPNDPLKEMVVALAGPAMNLALAAGLGLGWAIAGWWALAALAMVNLLLGLSNLIPAFPMDGGRVLRAALASKMGWLPASKLAIRIGYGFALLFGVGGAVSGWWSVALMGGMLVFALRYEEQRLQHDVFMGRVPRGFSGRGPRRYVARITRGR